VAASQTPSAITSHELTTARSESVSVFFVIFVIFLNFSILFARLGWKMELPSTEGMQVHSGFDDCVGNTPLILLSSLSHATSCLIYGARFSNA
jgi:hypothetical protein